MAIVEYRTHLSYGLQYSSFRINELELLLAVLVEVVTYLVLLLVGSGDRANNLSILFSEGGGVYFLVLHFHYRLEGIKESAFSSVVMTFDEEHCAFMHVELFVGY